VHGGADHIVGVADAYDVQVGHVGKDHRILELALPFVSGQGIGAQYAGTGKEDDAK
jgi:hypothetical protein